MSMGKGTVYHIISRFAFILSSYAIHIGMAYFLKDPREYGTLGVVISLVTMARVFLSTGMPQATSRFIAHDEENASAILRKGLKIQLMCSVIVMIIYVGGIPLWIKLLKDSSLSKYILASAILIPLMGTYQLYLGYFNGRRLFGTQAALMAIYAVLRLVFAFVLVLLGLKIFGVILGFILSATISIILSKIYEQTEPSSIEYDSIKLIKFAFPIVILSMGISCLLNLDVLMLKHFFPGSPIIGFYTGAMNLGKAPYFVLLSFGMTVLPSVSKALSDNNIERVKGLIKRNLSYLLLLSIPGATMVLATAGKLLDFIYPKAYMVAGDPLGIIVYSMCILALLFSLTSIITAYGRPIISMCIVLFCIPVQLCLGIYLIPRYGMNGAAIANFASVLTGFTIAGIVVYLRFKIFIDFPRILRAIFTSIILFSILLLFRNYSLLLLPIVYLLFLGLYVIIMALIGGLNKQDLNFALKMLAKP